MSSLTTIDSVQLEQVNGGYFAAIRGVIAGGAAVGALTSRAFTCGVGAIGGIFVSDRTRSKAIGTAMQQWPNCMNNPNYTFPEGTQTQPAAPAAPAGQ
jgi:hypothetical protein